MKTKIAVKNAVKTGGFSQDHAEITIRVPLYNAKFLEMLAELHFGQSPEALASVVVQDWINQRRPEMRIDRFDEKLLVAMGFEAKGGAQ